MLKKLTLLSTLVALCLGTMSLNAASLQAPGKFYIKSVLTGKYVILQHSMLADITADAGQAEVINVDYDLQENGEGIVTTLNSDNGDMIATLEFIKQSFKLALESENMATDYLDEMFTLHLVPTGDSDGSVFLCVDVPDIEDFDNIRNFLMEASNYQTAIVYYLMNMVPGNRHYLAVDGDGSFGFRPITGGEDCKWIMIPITNTAVDKVNAEQNVEGQAYDLQGRPITNPTAIYIQGGKVLMK